MRYFCERTEQKRSAMKNISRNILVYTAATVLVVGALPGARAQTVDTRIGSLSFERGLPTEDTVTKLFDTLDFQRACLGITHRWYRNFSAGSLPNVRRQRLRHRHLSNIS